MRQKLISRSASILHRAHLRSAGDTHIQLDIGNLLAGPGPVVLSCRGCRSILLIEKKEIKLMLYECQDQENCISASRNSVALKREHVISSHHATEWCHRNRGSSQSSWQVHRQNVHSPAAKDCKSHVFEDLELSRTNPSLCMNQLFGKSCLSLIIQSLWVLAWSGTNSMDSLKHVLQSIASKAVRDWERRIPQPLTKQSYHA